MSTQSSSPSPPPPDSPPSNSNPKPTPPLTTTTTTTTIPITKKPQPVPWTHQETIHLIQAYQEKWYSLKRGQLKASQWEEVAVTVSARCGYDDLSHSAKTATQCRHKMEKLRKRLRAEKQRLGPTASSSSSPWPYYYLMDSLQRGPLPISAHPLALLPITENENYNYKNYDEDDDEEEEDDDDVDGKRYSKSRSINYILRRPSIVNRFAGTGSSGGFSDFMQEPVVKKRRIAEEEEERGRGRRMRLELAAEIRGFAKRVMGVERRKMEIMRETERYRMEMENKRIEMILNSQKKLVDTITKTFGLLPENLKIEQEV